MTTHEKIQTLAKALDGKKAENLVALDLCGLTILSDCFLLATGNNAPQLKAMADAAEEKMAALGESPVDVEGYQSAKWILMDFGDVCVHLFDPETREFYNLEKIWGDAPKIDLGL